MPAHVRRVAGGFNVGLAAACIRILGWPDVELPWRQVTGNRTIRDIPERPISGESATDQLP